MLKFRFQGDVEWNYFEQFPAHLVTFTEEIHNGKLHFLYKGGIPQNDVVSVSLLLILITFTMIIL